MPRPSNQIFGFLFGKSGLTPAFQSPLRALIAEIPALRTQLLPVFRERFVTPPKLSDFSGLRNFRNILADIEGLPAPVPGYFDGIVVKPADYLKQGACQLLSASGTSPLSLEDAVNAMLRSAPKLATGSNNTFVQATANAEDFRQAMGFTEMVHAPFLAMDMTWWPSAQSTVLALVGKNIAVEAAILPVQNIINEAARANPGLVVSVDACHSYASMPRAFALNLFEPRQVAFVRSMFLAPLARPEAMLGLVLAKNNFLGKVSVVRPSFDPLEELATGLAEITLNANYDFTPVDYLLNTGSHSLNEISGALQKALTEKALSLAAFLDANYTARPGTVTFTSGFDGAVKNVITRGGEAYSMEAWLQQYNQLLEAKKAALTDVAKAQAQQLEELVTISSPTAEMESVATSLQNVQSQLDSPSLTGDLYDVVVQGSAGITTVSTQVNVLVTAAESSISTSQKQTMDALAESVKAQEEALMETTDKMEELENGAYEPEAEG